MRFLKYEYLVVVAIIILTIVGYDNLRIVYGNTFNVLLSKHVIMYGVVGDIIFDRDVDGDYYRFDIFYNIEGKQYKIYKIAAPNVVPLKYKKGDKIKIMVSKRHPEYAMVYDLDDVTTFLILAIAWSFFSIYSVVDMYRYERKYQKSIKEKHSE